MFLYVSDIEYNINVNNTTTKLIKVPTNGSKTMCTSTKIILCYSMSSFIGNPAMCIICDMKVEILKHKQMERKAFINCLLLFEERKYIPQKIKLLIPFKTNVGKPPVRIVFSG